MPLDLVRGRAKVIATNSSYKLVPFADALYGADAGWWASEGGAPSFAGLKITRDGQTCDAYPDVKRVRLRKATNGWHDDMILDVPGEIGWGGNSGFQAVNLAAQFGATTIVLIGLDATVEHGVHWHGNHGAGLTNPTLSTTRGWRKRLDCAAPTLAAAGITVLNASPISALTAFRKVDFCEFFGLEEYCIDEHSAAA